MIHEHNKYGDELELIQSEVDGPPKKHRRRIGPRKRYSTEGVMYQLGLKEYFKRRNEEFNAQHGPVRVIYRRSS